MNMTVNLVGEVIDPTITVMPQEAVMPMGSGHLVEIALECGLTLVLDDWQAADLSKLLSAAVRQMQAGQAGTVGG
ncbi:MAG: hypothetical protein U0984_07545 [Prosthecobacter sp.]|nr:hypothetical protein [Prosthecobacter sp.]